MNHKVMIGLLTHHGEYNPMMQKSLDALIRHSNKCGVSLVICRQMGPMIARSRNEAVLKTIENDCTHLLFIDSDMKFKDDCLMRLLNLDRDIVGGLCVARQAPYVPVVKRLEDDGISYKIVHGLEDGRFRSDVDAIGTAFMLVKTEVFKKIEQPWFAMPKWGDGIMGEDIYFCRLAKEAGYDICIEPDMLIGHIGEYVYTMNDYIAYRDERKNREKKEKTKVV